MTAKQRDAYEQGQLDAMLQLDPDAHRRYVRRWPSEAMSSRTPVAAVSEYTDAYSQGYRDQVVNDRELDALLVWRAS
ncbi:MAG: hypothetical protein KF773_24230 [Deltaproteobacteria bacterium]|nr:hypothetical protein [Deltaproteobacteria bacterium]